MTAHQVLREELSSIQNEILEGVFTRPEQLLSFKFELRYTLLYNNSNKHVLG